MEKNYAINNCAAILLAAGASSRLGTPKQLLLYKGKSLLQNTVLAATKASLYPVIVIVGANATLVKKELEAQNVDVINNTDWEEGIASSIRLGIEELRKTNTTADGAIIMVCDQPHITATLLNELITVQKKTGKPIVACNYSDTIGTPALFHQSFFPELLLLKGDKGAGKILRQYLASVAAVPFAEGVIDIDTMEDYKKLQQEE